MLATFFLVGSWLAGVALVRRSLTKALSVPEQFLWGLPVGWVFTTGLMFIAARAVGRLTITLVLIGTAAAWLGALLLSFRTLGALRTLLARGFSWHREHTGLVLVL